jgi:hypothetical protein
MRWCSWFRWWVGWIGGSGDGLREKITAWQWKTQ